MTGGGRVAAPATVTDVRGAAGPEAAAAAAGSAGDVVAVVVGLVRTLRAAGVDVGADRTQQLVRALATLDPSRRADVYWAGRVTLCGQRGDLAVYDRTFAAYFAAQHPLRSVRVPPEAPATGARTAPTGEAGPGEARADARAVVGASRTEVLRAADLAELDEAERREVHRLIARLAVPHDRRRTRRSTPARRGAVDRAATVRALLRSYGELDHVRRRRPRTRPRPLVVLVDVSGSMAPYADALIRFAHAARHRGAPTEAFSLSTRLTRLTDELGHRDADRAMAAVNARVTDWSGGTRLGELVKEFLDEWGRRGMARGATVVLLSDGWERGDPTVLGSQMARLSRLAHRVIWSNPRRARPGFAPVAGGMAAALPHVDDFVDGHSLAALERLADVVAGRETGRSRTGPGPLSPADRAPDAGERHA